ncbi:hypothetical protein O1611_g3635 [Lasiodiplodia mahajangana]|uniref:Uncharacterized protein n=1 Tax=Lasiodiplodia mahajangana TaxID=1108764 RepID=A0ACC2JR65_9PEZI|nr:hypothetical protein O1611_g3635 [Lasiodiplodia mahajangana]
MSTILSRSQTPERVGTMLHGPRPGRYKSVGHVLPVQTEPSPCAIVNNIDITSSYNCPNDHFHGLAFAYTIPRPIMALTRPKELPNFEEMARSFEAIAYQMRLFYNLPGCGDLPGSKDEGSSAPLNAPTKTVVDTLNDDIATIKTGLDRINDRFERMEYQILSNNNARETNRIIREENMSHRNSGDELVPLHSVYTNKEIPDFPKTVTEFNNLTSEAVMEILTALGDPFAEPIPGDEDRKRRKLAMFAGIGNRASQ